MKFEPIFAAFAGVLIFFAQQIPVGIAAPPRAFVAPPEGLKIFSFGYELAIADALWIRAIQDLDTCEKLASSRSGINTSMVVDRGGGKCNKGWVYHMIDAITDLDPRFYDPYLTGATMMSVLIEDRDGAKRIFEKGMAQFPKDWQLPFRASYHYLLEMNEPVSAADALVRAGKNGAPVWVFGLAAKLYNEKARAMLAKSVLEEALEHNPDARFLPRLQERLSEANRILESQARGSE